MAKTEQPLGQTRPHWRSELPPTAAPMGTDSRRQSPRISTASCCKKASDPSRGTNLYRAALAGPLRATTRKDSCKP